MPETRDINYHETNLMLDTSSGANPVGTKVHVCKKCGAVVVDRKVHNNWHKELLKAQK